MKKKSPKQSKEKLKINFVGYIFDTYEGLLIPPPPTGIMTFAKFWSGDCRTTVNPKEAASGGGGVNWKI